MDYNTHTLHATGTGAEGGTRSAMGLMPGEYMRIPCIGII